MRFLIAAVALACLVPIAARSQTDTALKLSTTVPQAAAEFKAGVADWENFSFESAASHLQSALKADPNFGLARAIYAFIGGNIAGELTPAQALAEANRGVSDAAAHGTTSEMLLAAAYREALRGDNKAAGALFRTATVLMPRDRLVAVNAVGFPAGTDDNIVPALRDFIAKNPDYAPTYNTLAYTLWGQNDKEGAEQAAKRQAELNPNAPNPHDTYAEILQWNGKFPEAIAEYRRATMTPPRFPEGYGGLAEVEALQGHYDQARAYLNQAIANAWTPQQKLSYMRQIAGTYALQGNAAETAKQLEAVANEAKTQQNQRATAIALAQQATAYANAGNASAAHQSIGAAKAVNPDVPWPVNYYATMSHGLLKHWGPAKQELAALKAKAAGDSTVSRDLIAAAEGYLATQQGRPADALKILSSADTTNFLIMNRIAEAHAALGHTAEATAWNNKINNNYQLNLADFTSVNARRRARPAR